MDQTQYKKVLELMLDLERKTDNRIDELTGELKRDVTRLLDDKSLKQEITAILDEKIDNLEFNFNNKIIARVELLEKAYDAQIKNYSIFENKMDAWTHKSASIEDTLRD